MTSPHISLAMLARSAYRPAGQQPRAEKTAYQPEPVRQTVKASPAVRVDLSAAARTALLGLQEIPLGAPPDLKRFSGPQKNSSTRPAAPQPYKEPGSRLNLSI